MKLSEGQLFLLFMLILFIGWVATGGPKKATNTNKPFLQQPAPIESGKPYSLKDLKENTRPTY